MQEIIEDYERVASKSRPLCVLDLGTIAYAECWDMQKQLARDLAEGQAADTLLLLEHTHTYTCGRRGGRNHILAGDEELARRGVSVLDVDRGGDVTYHGPGQLVAYPILRLAAPGQPVDYHAYLRLLEQALIDTLGRFGLEGLRVAGYSGVWVRRGGVEEKIAATGVKVDGRGISMHGIALNVTTDLSYFDDIVPCGIADKGVTSMAVIRGDTPAMEQVKRAFVEVFSSLFDFDAIAESSCAPRADV